MMKVCERCGGAIMAAGLTYGYAGPVCSCAWQQPRIEAARPTDEQRAKWLGDVLTENERLRRELREARDTNDFDAKRLRRLAMLLGLSVPESDETLLGCAGTVLGQACRAVEQLFGKTPNHQIQGRP